MNWISVKSENIFHSSYFIFFVFRSWEVWYSRTSRKRMGLVQKQSVSHSRLDQSRADWVGSADYSETLVRVCILYKTWDVLWDLFTWVRAQTFLSVNLVCFYVLELIGCALWSSRSAIDDKRRRLRAFLTCMRSDTPLMLNPGYVPQHLLVMASVLRYVVNV